MAEAKHRPMPDHEQWPAFVIPWDDNTPGPTDLSYLLAKPAGGKGFVRQIDGHFASGDGKRLRFWAFNLCTETPLPPLEYAPVVARRLAKYGVNLVRLHAIDHRWPKGILRRARDGKPSERWGGAQDETTRELDPEALARLDYFIYCCAEQGVYMDLNLNVARTFTEADGVAAAEQVRWGKGLTYFDPQLIALQKEYAAQLLNHVNPFTGRRYGDEPAIAFIELVNENSLIEFWQRGLLAHGTPDVRAGHWYTVPEYYATELDELWNRWLADKYVDRERLAAAWGGALKPYEDVAAGSVRRLTKDEFAAANAARFQDEAQFYTDLETRYFTDMKAYLRGMLGVQQLLLGTSDYHHNWSALPMLEANATLDIMDGHFYWQHPRARTPGRPWSRPDYWIPNTPMVDEPDASVVACCSRSRVAGHPYIVSEVNEPFPNDYACEFVPIIAAYSLLQDWDGIIFYDYDSNWGELYWQKELWREDRLISVFELSRDPVKWPQVAGGALMFLRGDVQAAKELVARSMPHDWVLDSLRQPSASHHPFQREDLPGRLALVHRTEIASFNAEAHSPAIGSVELPADQIVSDTGELTWEARPEDGRVLIDAPRHQAIIGRAGHRETSNLALDLETPFASVELAALDDRPISVAARMVLIAVARVAQTGQKWVDDTRQSTQTNGGDFGGAPTRLEPVTGTVRLKNLDGAQRITVRALDGHGQPRGEARTFHPAEAIRLTGEPATPWYLIEVNHR